MKKSFGDSLKNLSVMPMRIGTDESKRTKTETSSLQILYLESF